MTIDGCIMYISQSYNQISDKLLFITYLDTPIGDINKNGGHILLLLYHLERHIMLCVVFEKKSIRDAIHLLRKHIGDVIHLIVVY